MSPSRIYLIGYKSCGKSTTGRKLAQKLGFSFLDLDTFLEEKYMRSVPDIFVHDGEPEFRKKERLALEEVSDFDNVVISTGGGVPRFNNNTQLMLGTGVVVYLRLDTETMVGRLKVAAKDRPIVKGKTAQELREYVQNQRDDYEHFYTQANIIIDVKKLSTDAIVKEILDKIASV